MRLLVTHCSDLFGRLTTKVLELPDDTSITTVKLQLSAQLQVSSTAIVLQTQDNRILPDELTLSEAGLRENDSLSIDLRTEEIKTAIETSPSEGNLKSKVQWLYELIEVLPI